MFGQNKIAMIVAEFVGTFTLASVVLAMTGRTSFPYFAAVAAGATLGLFSLLVAAKEWAQLNPAVTVGLWTLRKIETTKAVVTIAAQFLGGAVAWRLNEYLLNTTLKSTANAKFDWRVFVAEAVGTLIFGYGVVAALQRGYQGFEKAFTVGASLAVGILIASFASNGLLNPAVALGVHSWSFVYVAAPILGAVVGMNLYMLLNAPLPKSISKRK